MFSDAPTYVTHFRWDKRGGAAGGWSTEWADQGSPYRELIFDEHWCLVAQLNEYLRLRQGGSPRTAHTYLAVLRPFMGFLIDRGYAWNDRPDRVRQYVRECLRPAGEPQ